MNPLKNNKPLKVAVLLAHLFFAAIFMLQAQSPHVGAIPGVIDVSPMGAATYTIPIEVVPGTQGVQPNLSIVYNSMSGMGLLGMKWSLAGLSAISRCGQTPYYDGDITAIQFNDNDRFSLDGNRLVAISGSYGAQKTEYATEMENFARIVSYGGTYGSPDYFEVYTDDGAIIQYGRSYAEEDLAKQQLTDGSNVVTLSWLINKITDVNGNSMIFNYSDYDGQTLLDDIHYTFNQGIDSHGLVEFEYTTLSNILGSNTCFLGGYTIPQTQLLESITVKYNTDVVRKYQFNYNTNNAGERTAHLKEVVLYGEGENEHLNSTTILWGEKNADIEEKVTDLFFSKSLREKVKILPGDFNGDGYTDLLVYTKPFQSGPIGWRLLIYNPSINDFEEDPSAAENYLKHKTLYAYDVNEDGKDELIVITPEDEFRILSLPTKTQIGSTLNVANTTISFGDFDGNGTIDILFATYRISNYKVIVRKIEENRLADMGTIEGSSGDACFNSVIEANGNGKKDIWAGNYIYEFNGLSFYELFSHVFDSDYNHVIPSMSYGDFNGDGISDVVAFYCSEDTHRLIPFWRIFMGKGDGTYERYDLDNEALNTEIINQECQLRYKIMVADIDGDGKDDIIQVMDGEYSAPFYGFTILFSKGWVDGSYIYKKEERITQDLRLPWDDVSIGDFNGDAKLDIIVSAFNLGIPYVDDPKQGQIYYIKEKYYESVKEIKDGIGKKILLNYKHNYFLTKSFHNISQISSVTSYKKYFLPLLESLQVTNGIGDGLNTWQYEYKNPSFSILRRTFIGFREFSCTNNQTNEKEIRSFEFYDAPYSNLANKQILRPTQIIVSTNNVIKNKTTYTYNLQELLHGRSKPYFSETIAEDILLDIKTVTTNRVDGIGWLFESNTNTYNSRSTSSCLHSKKTTYSYQTIKLVGNQRKTVPTSILTEQRYENSNTVLAETTSYGYYTDPTNKGRLAWEQKGNNDGSITTSYENYLVSGVYQLKTVSALDCAPRSETYTYDVTQRFMMSVKNALNHEVKFTYDAKTGNKTTEIDPNGLTTKYYYDSFGNLTKVVNPDNTETNTTVEWYLFASIPNAKYKITTTATAKPNVTVYYDLLGREVCRNDDGYYYETQYNNLGQTVRTSYPFAPYYANRIWHEYTYDAYGRKQTETAPYTDFTYGYDNRKVTVTDHLRNDIESSKNYDALGRITKAEDYGGAINYRYSVTAAKRHQTTISAVGANTTILTDQWGNRRSIQDPDAGEIVSTYNKFNELKTQTDANGNLTSYEYDLLGRVIQKKFTVSNSTSQTIDYIYDYINPHNKLKGKLYQIKIDGVKSETFNYDDLSRLWFYDKVIDNTTYTFMYEYTPAGKLETLTYPDNFAVNYSYTSAGKLSEIRRIDDNSNSLIYKVHSRNMYNQVTHCEYGNEVATYSAYNEFGLPTRIQTGIKTSTIIIVGPWNPHDPYRGDKFPPTIYDVDSSILNYRYAYNDRGLMSFRSESITGRMETFTYDDLDRLTSVTDGATPQIFTYQQNGNLLSNSNLGTYIYETNLPAPKPHAVSHVTIIDNALISENQCDVSYNYFNQPIQITEESASARLGCRLNLFYNANQQRNKAIRYSKKSHNYVLENTRIYVDKRYEKEINAANATLHYHYIYGDEGVVALHIANATTNTDSMYYVHTDHLGSYCAITSANKQVRQRNYFDPWGNIINLTRGLLDPIFSETTLGDFPLTNRGFTGHEHYPYFKIINMNGRLYDPVIGRLFSPDNFVQNPYSTQGYNRYSYALNNPLKYKDPTGQWYEDYDDYDRGDDDDDGGDPWRKAGMRSGIGHFPGGHSDRPNSSGSSNRYDEQNESEDHYPPGWFEVDYSDYENPNEDGPDDHTYPSHPNNPGGGASPAVTGTTNLLSTMFGGSLSWAAAETVLENGKVWTNSLKFMKVGGKVIGVVGAIPTAYNFGVKVVNGKLNTSDFVDLGASVGFLAAGLMLSNPVGIGLVVGAGLVYGIYRISAGEKADDLINQKFGFK